MTTYFRVSVGKNAAYLDQAIAGNFIGTGWLAGVDLTGAFPDDWREFNRRYVPTILEIGDVDSNIAAGLACGMTWTVARGIAEDDVVLVPTGRGTYRVARVVGPYHYAPQGPLPHRRSVEWQPDEIDRSALSEALRRSLGSAGTVVALDDYAEELSAIIGDAPRQVVVADPTVEDPWSFVLERHLEDFLVSNWSRTALGRDYDIATDKDGEPIGRQYATDTGPIDILAQSKDGTEMLVIELKRGRVSDVVVGQILRYMGYIAETEPAKSVRGVVIGLEDDARFRRALAMVPHVSFMRYEVKFRLIADADDGAVSP